MCHLCVTSTCLSHSWLTRQRMVYTSSYIYTGPHLPWAEVPTYCSSCNQIVAHALRNISTYASLLAASRDLP